MAKFCPKCGAQARDTATNCPVCDAPFDPEQLFDEPAQPEPQGSNIQQPMMQQQVEQPVQQPMMQQQVPPIQMQQQMNQQIMNQGMQQPMMQQQANQQYWQQQNNQQASQIRQNQTMNDMNVAMNSLNEAGQHAMPQEGPTIVDASGQPMNPNAVYKPDTVMCILCYLGILALIPYFQNKQDVFIQFHAKQGLNIAIVCLGVFFAIGLLSVIPGINLICPLLYVLAFTAELAYIVMGILSSTKGEMKLLPLMEKVQILK
jgi:uncharacterized membrane protein